MNPEDIAPMVVAVVLIVTSGGVLVLRPLLKRLGNYLDLLVEERRQKVLTPPPDPATERLVAVIEGMDQRLARLEERQAFTDALLSGDRRSKVESIPPATR